MDCYVYFRSQQIAVTGSVDITTHVRDVIHAELPEFCYETYKDKISGDPEIRKLMELALNQGEVLWPSPQDLITALEVTQYALGLLDSPRWVCSHVCCLLQITYTAPPLSFDITSFKLRVLDSKKFQEIKSRLDRAVIPGEQPFYEPQPFSVYDRIFLPQQL